MTPAPPASAAADGPDGDAPRALVVGVGTIVLAIPAEAAVAVVRATPVTPVGGAPPWVIGVTAVRGRVMAVADLPRLAEVVPADGADAWLVIVEHGARTAALAGLAVRRVVAIAPAGGEGADGAEGPAPTRAAAGLPIRGDARLARDDERAVAAIPARVPVLDVSALLDMIHDDPTRDGD